MPGRQRPDYGAGRRPPPLGGGATSSEVQSLQAIVPAVAIIDPDATAQYEQWLTSASRIVIRNQGGSKKPVVETIALDVSGKMASGTTGFIGTLILEVSVDPEKKDEPNSTWSSIRNAEPWWVFRAELKLPDGRVVMNAANTGISSTQAQVDHAAGQAKRPEVHVMDRDGPVRMADASTFSVSASLCDPLSAKPKTLVTHPQSADEMLRQGYQLYAPRSTNGATKTCNIVNMLLGVPTCCALPALLSCCISPPDVHFEFKELRSGDSVEGARCTEKGRVMCAVSNRVPNGDTIEFSERAPLQVRKDMLAIAFYQRVIAAAAPVITSA